jgi:pyruvate dehydrogenase E1 component beta subunit
MPEMMFREALNRAMREEMKADESIFLMGEEVAEYNGAYKVSEGLLDEFGEKRVIDTPIAELGFVGVGVGASMGGLKPIIEVMTFNFAMLALDAVINTAAKTRYMTAGKLSCPLVLRGPTGAGGALAAQHSQSLESQYTHIPGLKVMSPATPEDAYGMLRSAIQDPDPVVFFEHETLYGVKGEVPEEEYTIPIGKGDIKREGDGVTVISWSRQMRQLMEFVDDIVDETGVEVELLDLRTLRPIDEELIVESIKKTNRAVIVEEAWEHSSVGATIADRIQRLAFDYLDAPIHRVTQRDVPMPYSPPLEKYSLPSKERIVEAIKAASYID